MPLKCCYVGCAKFELAQLNQLAFYQDINTGGWNLALAPEFVVPTAILPINIRLLDTGDERFPYKAVCNRCLAEVGTVNTICGFKQLSVNFSSKKVYLLHSSYSALPVKGAQKWSKVMNLFPEIRRITATIQENVQLVAIDTINFHGVSDLDEIIRAGMAVSSKSNLCPRRYQWNAYFFSSFNNVLLCLPTGMGKTLIANMLMKAYHKRNPNKGQAFIVPTVVLVEQQAAVIESNTGLKVIRRSGEQFKTPWSTKDICVCTPGMLLNAIKVKEIDMSQLSLLILDEVHEANSSRSQYGLLLSYIVKCPIAQRPRVLGLTASPTGSNSSDMSESISTLCKTLGAVPYMPLLDDSSEKGNSTTCTYVPIHKTSFEVRYEMFVIEALEGLVHLHDFFTAHWKPLPVNLFIQIKVDKVMKILSHSRLVARNMADIQLFQLTQWMSKWIDSLDMLQIVGPRKLIQFIIADLDYAQKNDALSRISSKIIPIVNEMRTTINRMVNEYEISENSPKLQELLSLLKSHQNGQERILIFVDRRNTAERLCRRLKEDPDISKMNPVYVVGHANTRNFLKEMQQEILEKFRKGEYQVLVATSVLEQGIDVAACGLVVCFDGVKSIKSIIQSRGRARLDIANFVAFVAADKQRKANELSQMEIAMNYAVRQLMQKYNSAFDPIVAQEIEKFLNSDNQDNWTTNEPNEENDDDDDDDENNDEDAEMATDQKVIQLRFFYVTNSKALVEHIENCFSSPFDRIKVTKQFIYAYFAVTNIETDSKIIKDVSSISGRKSSSWIDVSDNIPMADGAKDNCTQLEEISFDSLRGFYFKDFTTVSYDRNFIWNGKFKLIISNHQGHKEIMLAQDSRYFTIQSIDIEGPILINDTKTSFEIFLCLRNPPNYFIDKQYAHYDFANTSFNLSLKRNSSVDSKITWNLRDTLQYFTMQIYNVSHLKQDSFDDESASIDSEDFTREYVIKAWHSMHSAVLPTILPKNILEKMCDTSTTSLNLLLNNTTPIRFHKLQIQHVKDVQLPFTDCDPPSDNYAIIGRVKVTPSRFIFLPFEVVPKNRILRYFPNPNNYLLVSFADEHSGMNPWRSTNVCEWFLSVLQNGIKVGSKLFTFLCCSNSQLREGRCWFSSLDRDMVYDKIGEFPENWTAGRKLTRLALAFASSFPTVPLDHERYLKTVAPDIKCGNVNFSDGIGRASHELIEKLRAMLNIPQKTSAFQIRIGGIKGVVSVFDQQEDVMFRESMKKFESKHTMLEVLNYSRPTPLFLNRHVILLLSSFGIPDDVFLEMQYKMLVKCMETLVDDDSSLCFVKSHSSIFDWNLYPPAHLVREPFFSQMLFSNAINQLSGITNHAHLPVADGRVLMGVMDETSTLKYGEIYAHIVEGDYNYEVEGRVLVFRNPCVLPSDIRVLNARKTDCCRLKELYQNCLVIPSRGPDSHARECSGGDLDGDLYYVVWDESLIPANLQVPGEKIVEIKTNENETDTVATHESMMQFYCDYVSKNQLGSIANAHLALSDQLGMRHPKSVKLAKYVTVETDAPKKGLTVGKIDAELQPNIYPDFMEKSDKPSYRSETVLGELYRQSKPILEIVLEKRALTLPRLKISVTENQISVENYYALYSFQVKTLLHSFDLQSEVDLFSGTPMWHEDYMSTYKQQNQMRKIVVDNVQALWNKWMAIFDKWRLKISNDQQKISQWFHRPKSSPWPIHSFSFLAMPYVNFDECNRKSISEKIFESSRRWIFTNKMQWLSEWRMRFQAGEEIIRKLKGIECHFYGSSMLGLNEEYSDIDLYAGESNFDHLRESLKQLDGNVLSMKKPHVCVSLTFQSLPIDVTNFIFGVEKTYNLAATFDENPGYWAALRVLMEWARTARIVKSGGSEGLMTVISFCHLFIYFATKLPLRRQCDKKPYSLIRFGNWIESMRDTACGELIFNFLKLLSNRNSRTWLMEKLDPFTSDPLIKSDLIAELRKNAEMALYILAVNDGDIQKLFQYCSKKRLFRLEKAFIDPITASKEEQQQCLKEMKTICNPSKCSNLFFQLLDRNGVFYVEVIGDHKYFVDVEKGLNRIHCKIRNTRVRALRNDKTYHVVNATMIIAEFGKGPSTEVSFYTYEDELFMATHTGIWKFKLMFRNERKDLNWRTIEYRRYENQFIKQLDLFKEKHRMAIKGSRNARFFGKMFCNVRVGNHYLFHIPESLHNTFETITLYQIEKSIAHLQEALNLEEQENIVQDFKNYNSLTMLRSYQENEDDKPLKLMPLHEVKTRFAEQKKKDAQVTSTSASSNKHLGGIRHSFYPNWSHGINGAKKFAAMHGFTEVQPEPDDYYTTISVIWRQRELVVACDRHGMITEIRHRSTRWFSATFNRSDKGGGDDIRTYLECRASLDDDESCLETVIEYLNGRSIFAENFAQQIEQSRCQENHDPFVTRPLIPDIFHLNWRFRSMRVITPVLKFVNAGHDVIVFHSIYDGIFQVNKREFEWFPKHLEYEIRFCMNNVSDEELCRKSYVLSLELFDYTKVDAAMQLSP